MINVSALRMVIVKYFMVTKEKTKEMLKSFIKYMENKGLIICDQDNFLIMDIESLECLMDKFVGD